MSTAPIPQRQPGSGEILKLLEDSLYTAIPLAEVVEIRNARVSAVASRIGNAVSQFMNVVEHTDIVDVPEAEREMEISFYREEPENYSTDNGWVPGSVTRFTSNHPFAKANPLLSEAADILVQEVIETTRGLGEHNDPRLTYLDVNRSKGGRKTTVVTEALMGADDGLGDWIKHLPDATRIRPVSIPYKDGTTIFVNENGDIEEKPNTPAMSALLGGSLDGRSVVEREAWERAVLRKIDLPNIDSNGTLKITSLGTGTGEPAIDTGLAILNESTTIRDKKLIVRGFDIDSKSLQVAEHIANSKVNPGISLEFDGKKANLLSRENLIDAVAGTQADVYEAIGLSEYIPSSKGTNDQEKKQRALMEHIGNMSAEEFFQTIYDNMPTGSVLLTGNMRKDSPQAEFVINGLGWKGIIQRSTEEYLGIFERAGIPNDAVNLYVPDPNNSGKVFNLVMIKKL